MLLRRVAGGVRKFLRTVLNDDDGETTLRSETINLAPKGFAARPAPRLTWYYTMTSRLWFDSHRANKSCHRYKPNVRSPPPLALAPAGAPPATHRVSEQDTLIRVSLKAAFAAISEWGVTHQTPSGLPCAWGDPPALVSKVKGQHAQRGTTTRRTEPFKAKGPYQASHAHGG